VVSSRLAYHWLLGTGLFLIVLAWPAGAQVKPSSLTGEITTGYYSDEASNGRSRGNSGSPLNLTFDLRGFLGHPDFLDFSVKPHLSLASHTRNFGFSNATGIVLSASILRRRRFPLTIRYQDTATESVSLGPAFQSNQLHARQPGQRIKAFGLSSSLRLPGLSPIRLSYETSQATLGRQVQDLPSTGNETSTFAASLQEQRWGWGLRGDVRWWQLSSDLLSLTPSRPTLLATDQSAVQYDFMADRTLWGGSRVAISGGVANRQVTFAERDNTSNLRYINALFGTNWGKRWKADFRFGHTSNLTESALREFNPSTASVGADLNQSELAVFLPSTNELASTRVGGTVQFELSPSWQFQGSTNLRQDAQPAANTEGIGSDPLHQLNTQGGVQFARQFRWGRLSAGYNASLLMFGGGNFDSTQEERNALGHAAELRYARGTLETLQVSAGLTANLSSSAAGSSSFSHTSSRNSLDVSVGRRWRSLVFYGSISAF
jgi:hypothetical protein